MLEDDELRVFQIAFALALKHKEPQLLVATLELYRKHIHACLQDQGSSTIH